MNDTSNTLIVNQNSTMTNEEMNNDLIQEVITFGGGCFWCSEAIFEEVIGVETVVSGYSGGKVLNPTYSQVCSDTSGHAECIQITYDPTKVTLETLLDIFMKTHDPTTLNRQGNDAGTQYRSIVFYSNEEQKIITETYITKLNGAKYYADKVVTQVVPLSVFYPAEAYHQDYFAKNPNEGYCQYVVAKKVEKFEHLFPEKVKEQYK